MKNNFLEENMLDRCVSECEKAVITHVLKKTKGNESDAARLLGLSERILTRKVRKYGIDAEHCTERMMGGGS
ncbi:MAG: helix-turn-helix domain-containing protein [Smithellaceae bacterium]